MRERGGKSHIQGNLAATTKKENGREVEGEAVVVILKCNNLVQCNNTIQGLKTFASE